MKNSFQKMIIIYCCLCGQIIIAQTPGTLNWTFATGDWIASSPAIGNDGSIYFGSYDSVFYAINSDGSQKWAFKTNDYITSSPAIGSDGTIYVGSWDNNLYAINSNGSLKWQFSTYRQVRSSPAIGIDGTIYVGSGQSVYAINPEGKTKWQFLTDGYVLSSPSIGSNGTIYFGSYNYQLFAVNPDGSKKWAFNTGGVIYSSVAVGDDGTVYVGSQDRKLYAINVDGSQKWAFTTGGWIVSSPAIGCDGTIYVGSEDGKFYAIDEDGNQKWVFTTGDTIDSSPAIDSDGTIYVGCQNHKLYAINPDGSQKWTITCGDDIFSSPTIDRSGKVYVGSFDGKFYAINTGSKGLSKSQWPKYRLNAKNEGRSLSVRVITVDVPFKFISSDKYRNSSFSFYNDYLEALTITNCIFNNSSFSISTTLPLNIPPKTNKTLLVTFSAEKTGRYSSQISIEWHRNSQSLDFITYTSLREDLFIEDGGEKVMKAHEAFDKYEVCKANKPDSPASLNNLSVLFLFLGEYNLALFYEQQALSAALNSRDGYTGIKLNQGVIYSEQQKVNEAKKLYTDLLKNVSTNSPLSPQIYFNLAYEAYLSDSMLVSWNLINKVLTPKAGNKFLLAKAYVLRGAIYCRLGGNMTAIRDDFERAVTLDPYGPIGKMAQENLTSITDVINKPNIIPKEYLFLPNFPNPFNKETRIRFALRQSGNVEIRVFNMAGQQVCQLINEIMPVGWHEVVWNGMDEKGRFLGSGIYLMKIQSGKWQAVQKMTLLR